MSAPRVRSRPPVARAAVRVAAATAVALTAHTALNVRRLRTPTERPAPVAERVSVLLPVRDEAERVGECLSRLLAQRRVPQLEILVLDDGSTDGTADVVKAVAAGDRRVTLLHGLEPPDGWLGKPHACHQLASAATGSALVFVDADVLLEPHGVAATVHQLRDLGLDLVSPYPRQVAVTVAERLVQPLLQWSWLTTLPLHLAERSDRPSLSAANGQLLAVDRAAYERAGGHAAVRDEVLDDLALLRAVKRAGGRGTVTDGTPLATCRMYTGWSDLRDGYTKSLGAGFGSPAGAVAVAGALGATYVLPAAAALTGSPAGLAGYAAGVLGRVLAARRTGGRAVPDSFAHPLSIAVFGYLTLRSLVARRRGTATWKGRPVTRRVTR